MSIETVEIAVQGLRAQVEGLGSSVAGLTEVAGTKVALFDTKIADVTALIGGMPAAGEIGVSAEGMAAALQPKADTATVNAALAEKADTSQLNLSVTALQNAIDVLANLIAQDVQPRLLPAGGAVGQIPVRTANGYVWVDMPTGGTAPVEPEEPTGPVNDVNALAILRYTEGTAGGEYPATIPNYASSGLTFSNKGPNGTVGGRPTTGGAFGNLGLHARTQTGGPIAIICDQLVTAGPGMTHEAFYTDGLNSGRFSWMLTSGGVDSSSTESYLRLFPVERTGGNWSMILEMKMPGVAHHTACETTLFVPNVGATPNWIVTQWRDDGYLEIWVNGQRLAVSAQAYTGSMVDTHLTIFGDYNYVNGGTNGMYQVILGPTRFSNIQRYTGTSVPVPTAPYEATISGGSGGTGSGGGTAGPVATKDITDSNGAVVQSAYTDIALNFNDPDKGILYRYGAPATRTDAPTLDERADNGFIDYGNGSKIYYQFGTQNDNLHNEFVSNHGCVLYAPDGTKTATNSLTWLASYGIDRRTVYQRPQRIWSNAGHTPGQLSAYITGSQTHNSGTIDPSRPEDMACVQTRWTGPSDSGADRMSLVATRGSATRGARVFTIGTQTAQQQGIVELAPGMTPTCMEVSPGGEFAFVGLWDHVNFVGRIAVISLGSVPYARTWQNVDDWYDWWHDFMDMCHPGLKNKGGWSFLKVLGYLTLPSDMKAPTSLFVQTGNNPTENISDAQGNSTNIGKECSPLETHRGRLLDQNDYGKFIPKGGLLIVGSKSEKKVKFYDLAPLISYTNDMYLGTLAKNLQTQYYQLNGAGAPASSLGVNGKRYLNTSNGDVYLKTNGAWALTLNIGTKRGLGMGANQWPYTFTEVPAQMPVLVKSVDFPENIAAIRGTVFYNYWTKDDMRRTPGTPYINNPNPNYPHVWIVTTNGKLYIYNVGRYVPGGKPVDQAPAPSEISQAGVVTGLGDQIVHAACVRDYDVDLKGVAWDAADGKPQAMNEMLLVVDRKNRRFVWVQFSLNNGSTGEIANFLEDSRIDPISAEHIEPYHVSNKVISCSDYTGKCVRNYRVMTTNPLRWDSLGTGAVTYPTLSTKGEHAGKFDLPGRPFSHHTSNAP